MCIDYKISLSTFFSRYISAVFFSHRSMSLKFLLITYQEQELILFYRHAFFGIAETLNDYECNYFPLASTIQKEE